MTFFRWDISVIFPTIELKPTTLFTSYSVVLEKINHLFDPVFWEATDIQELVRYLVEVSNYAWYGFKSPSKVKTRYNCLDTALLEQPGLQNWEWPDGLVANLFKEQWHNKRTTCIVYTWSIHSYNQVLILWISVKINGIINVIQNNVFPFVK